MNIIIVDREIRRGHHASEHVLDGVLRKITTPDGNVCLEVI